MTKHDIPRFIKSFQDEGLYAGHWCILDQERGEVIAFPNEGAADEALESLNLYPFLIHAIDALD